MVAQGQRAVAIEAGQPPYFLIIARIVAFGAVLSPPRNGNGLLRVEAGRYAGRAVPARRLSRTGPRRFRGGLPLPRVAGQAVDEAVLMVLEPAHDVAHPRTSHGVSSFRRNCLDYPAPAHRRKAGCSQVFPVVVAIHALDLHFHTIVAGTAANAPFDVVRHTPSAEAMSRVHRGLDMMAGLALPPNCSLVALAQNSAMSWRASLS